MAGPVFGPAVFYQKDREKLSWLGARARRQNGRLLSPSSSHGLLIDLLLRLIVGTVEDGRLILLYTRYPVFYLVIPVIAIVLMLAIVFSFQSCQEMAVFHQERAERIVLENQIIQLKISIKESQQMYDTLRSVRHDIKNHLMVLRGLLLQNAAEIHEEILAVF